MFLIGFSFLVLMCLFMIVLDLKFRGALSSDLSKGVDSDSGLGLCDSFNAFDRPSMYRID